METFQDFNFMSRTDENPSFEPDYKSKIININDSIQPYENFVKFNVNFDNTSIYKPIPITLTYKHYIAEFMRFNFPSNINLSFPVTMNNYGFQFVMKWKETITIPQVKNFIEYSNRNLILPILSQYIHECTIYYVVLHTSNIIYIMVPDLIVTPEIEKAITIKFIYITSISRHYIFSRVSFDDQLRSIGRTERPWLSSNIENEVMYVYPIKLYYKVTGNTSFFSTLTKHESYDYEHMDNIFDKPICDTDFYTTKTVSITRNGEVAGDIRYMDTCSENMTQSALNNGFSRCICKNCLRQYDHDSKDLTNPGFYFISPDKLKIAYMILCPQFSNKVFKPIPNACIFDGINGANILASFTKQSININSICNVEYIKYIFLDCLSDDRFIIDRNDVNVSFNAFKLYNILSKKKFIECCKRRDIPVPSNEDIEFLEIMGIGQELSLSHLSIVYYAMQDNPAKFNQIMGENLFRMFIYSIADQNSNYIWLLLAYRYLGEIYTKINRNTNGSATTKFTYYYFNGEILKEDEQFESALNTSCICGDLRTLLDELIKITSKAAEALASQEIVCLLTEYAGELIDDDIPTLDLEPEETLNKKGQKKTYPFKYEEIKELFDFSSKGYKIKMKDKVIKFIESIYTDIKSTKLKSTINGCIKQTVQLITRCEGEFDANPCCFGVGNGVLYSVNVDRSNSKLIFRKNEPEDYVTKFTRAEYDPSLHGNRNYNFILERLSIMFPEKHVLSWILSFTAGSFRGIPPKTALFLVGGMNTGKTSFGQLIKNTLSVSYTSTMQGDYFTKNVDKTKPDSATSQSAEARHTTIEEFIGTIIPGPFKYFTGGGGTKLAARNLYAPMKPGGIPLCTRLMFLSNQLPEVILDTATLNRIALYLLTVRYESSKNANSDGTKAEITDLSSLYSTMYNEMLLLLVEHYGTYRSDLNAEYCDLENVPDIMKLNRLQLIKNSPLGLCIERYFVSIPPQNKLILSLNDMAKLVRALSSSYESESDIRSTLISLLPSTKIFENHITGWDNLMFIENANQSVEDLIKNYIDAYESYIRSSIKCDKRCFIEYFNNIVDSLKKNIKSTTHPELSSNIKVGNPFGEKYGGIVTNTNNQFGVGPGNELYQNQQYIPEPVQIHDPNYSLQQQSNIINNYQH